MTKQSRAQRIADLNDKFRKGPSSLSAFNDFNADNKPHRDHGFGSYELEGEKLFWKIDSYERELV